MPATDQHCYHLPRLHRIFGLSSVLLLIATIWMFAIDHRRPWKEIQRQHDRIDVKMSLWRERQLLADGVAEEADRLREQLLAVEAEPVPPDLLAAFRDAVRDDARRRGEAEPSFARLDQLTTSAGDAAGIAERAAQRQAVLTELHGWIREARFREDRPMREKRLAGAQRDVVKATLGFAVRDSQPPEEISRLQREIDRLDEQIRQLTWAGDAAAEHRRRLDGLMADMTRQEQSVRKQLHDQLAEVHRQQRVRRQKETSFFQFHGPLPVPGAKWLELPVIDALNSPRRIENLWSEGLEQPSGSFGTVRRFDRCTTCHQGLHKAFPGEPDQPLLPPQHLVDLFLELPASADAADLSLPDAPADVEQMVLDVLGVQFAPDGLLEPDASTVVAVRPRSPAALARFSTGANRSVLAGDVRDRMLHATAELPAQQSVTGLRLGDVLVAIADQPLGPAERNAVAVAERLLAAVETAREAAADSDRMTIHLTVRRGLPSPYAGHPRLDLFVGDGSPHPSSRFGCTACHAGQGSATSFAWASHSPDDPETREAWRARYGWFHNPHWTFPMLPRRFAQSACIQCHHNVTDLEPSDRFPDAPAPQLLEGYRLTSSLGCFGCHEINGYREPGERVGPDLRLEPNYHAAAQLLRGDPNSGYDRLTQEERDWVDRLIHHPEDEVARRGILDMVLADAHAVSDSANRAQRADEEAAEGTVVGPRFSPTIHRTVASLLKDHDVPGSRRKVGPSLRMIGTKLDRQFLLDWIEDPEGSRPGTRMPHSFGLWDHLPATDVRRRLEPVMIQSMVRYLLERSQPFTYQEPDAILGSFDDRYDAQVERGRVAFEQRGCLACHDHGDFPDIRSFRDPDFVVTGPDLTDTATRFAASRNPAGARWLYSWIQQPARYHPRTTMPPMTDESTTSVNGADSSGWPAIDPVADIVAFLLDAPDAGPLDRPRSEDTLTAEHQQILEQITLDYLRESFPEAIARRYAAEGIPESFRATLVGAELELLMPEEPAAGLTDDDRVRRRMMYVGRKSLAHHGCHACHDIPGLEDAQPIGPALSDWGRKDPAQLAFGHVLQYVRGPSGDGRAHATQSAEAEVTLWPTSREALPAYYYDELRVHSRIGFMFQKLTEPHSFDFRDVENKRYTERLRMPQFSLTEQQREAIMTFFLGLTADPPAKSYVFEPDARRKAILEGREVLTRHSCQGCHLLELEEWRLAFPPDYYGPQRRQPTFPFMHAEFAAQAVEQSLKTDTNGLRAATLVGMPAISDDGKVTVLDDEDFPLADEEEEWFDSARLMYAFQLWKPAMLEGHPYYVGDGSLDVAAEHIRSRRQSAGGALTKYLLPRVVEREKLENPNAKGAEAWGWLPPALVGLGTRVQLEWLHDYLLDPQPIRPAVVMQMPRYQLTPEEATTLVRYFAAHDDSRFPYHFQRERRDAHLKRAEARYQQVLDELRRAGELPDDEPIEKRHLADAMRLVTDGSYCVKCHRIGDFDPAGSDRVKAPDLAQVHRRLRADFVRRWMAKPTAELPYTPMPVNIPYDPSTPRLGTTVPQNLYRGDSVEQLDAVVDLLMNFDQYLRQRTPVTPSVEANR